MGSVQTITRSADGATIETNKRRRTARAIWSSDDVDAHRSAFVMGGIDTSRFAANPTILYEHGQSTERGRLPVANAIEYGPDRFRGKNVFVGTSRFWEDDEFAERLFDRYASGQLRGWSINVQPLEASPPTHEERRARGDLAEADVIYRSVRLLEVSCVSIPSNPSTLTLSVERRLGGAAASRRPSIAIDARAWTHPRVAYAEIQRLLREEQFARVRRQHRAMAGKVPDASKMSDEELHLAIQRLELEAKYYAMLGQSAEAARKRAEQAAHEAAAAEREKALAEFAAGAGKRS